MLSSNNKIHSNARNQLFASSNSTIRRRNNGKPSEDRIVGKDEELINATADLTQGLRSTMQLMQEELDKSVISTELLR